MKNLNHDLIQQLAHVSTSAWHIQQYLKDTEDDPCPGCKEAWTKISDILENQVMPILMDEIKRHVERGTWK